MKRTIGLLLLLCVALFVGCSDDNNTNTAGGGAPAIISVTPNAVSIGQKNGEAVISGTNLNGATLVALGDGVAVDSYTVNSATEIAVKFTVAGNITGAPKTVIVVTPAGTASNGSIFQVLNNHVPRGSYTVDPPSGSLSTVITFDATGITDPENNISSYKWDFGDGTSGQGKKVTHKYASVGKFNATLRVADSQQGYTLVIKEIQISKNSPPVARFTVEPGTSGSTGTVFLFDASKSSDAEGKVKGYQWDFGDGARAKDKVTVEHQYSKEGDYVVSLTVFDAQNQASAPAEERMKVEKSSEVVCTRGTGAHRLIFGRVVAVEPGNWAVTAFGAGHNCGNTFHKCDDYRRADPENFYGIVDSMKDRGNGILAVHNKCPYRWPPAVGEKVFLIYKTCTQNHCP